MHDPMIDLDRHRRSVETSTGSASVIDTGGDGPAAVFVHGVGTSSYLWRHVIAELSDERRCVAVDLPGHGSSPIEPGQDLSLPGLATFIGHALDSLGLDDVDLVANDTGGAVSQIVVTRQAERFHSLTLTNCETHTNLPPKAFLPTVMLARAGLLAPLGRRILRDAVRAKRRVYGMGYADVARLPDEVARAWLEATFGTRERATEYQRLIAGLHGRDLVDIEPALRRLDVPTLVVWGTADPLFSRRWAYWLNETIPGARGVVEVRGGRLFFPDERADELVPTLRLHWQAGAA